MDLKFEENRIYAEDEKGLLQCEVTFPALDENTVTVNHVFVNTSLRGGGVASSLMLETYKYIKNKNLKIVARCPYAVAWFKKHKQYQDILVNQEAENND